MRTNGISALAALALITACGGSQGNGTVSVLLKDAPAGFEAAVVTISEVDMVGSGGTLVLTTNKTTTDLLTLANDTAALVSGATVPTGKYTQLRFVITGAYVQVNGKIYASSPSYEGLPAEATVAGALTMPSFGQSGLKIDLPAGGLDVGTDAKVLVVDFDVSQSFGQAAGGSGGWVMHPVVHATDVELTGSIDVALALGPEVSLPAGVGLGDFKAVLVPAGGTESVVVPLTAAAGSETFGVAFQYLAPGDYSLSLQAPAGVASFTTDPAVPLSLKVTSGQATAATFQLLSATAP